MLRNTMLALSFIAAFNNTWAGPLDPIVSMVWVGESMPDQTSSTLQLNLTTVKPINLLSISSPVAKKVEIHSLMMHKGKMRLHIVNSFALPAHRTTVFGTRGLFLMMTGLNKPLNIGDKIPITLKYSFPDKQIKTIAVEAEVKQMELSYKHYGPNEVYDHR